MVGYFDDVLVFSRTVQEQRQHLDVLHLLRGTGGVQRPKSVHFSCRHSVFWCCLIPQLEFNQILAK